MAAVCAHAAVSVAILWRSAELPERADPWGGRARNAWFLRSGNRDTGAYWRIRSIQICSRVCLTRRASLFLIEACETRWHSGARLALAHGAFRRQPPGDSAGSG